MFGTALIFRLLGISDLLLARLVSVAVGGLTILGIYIYGKERFSQESGLLAAVLLAISPFFLSFAKVAFTETDVFLACTLTWFLVAFSRVHEEPTIGRAVVAGLILGLSISTNGTLYGTLHLILYISYQMDLKIPFSPNQTI